MQITVEWTLYHILKSPLDSKFFSSSILHHIGKSHTKNRFLGQNEFNGAVFYSYSVCSVYEKFGKCK